MFKTNQSARFRLNIFIDKVEEALTYCMENYNYEKFEHTIYNYLHKPQRKETATVLIKSKFKGSTDIRIHICVHHMHLLNLLKTRGGLWKPVKWEVNPLALKDKKKMCMGFKNRCVWDLKKDVHWAKNQLTRINFQNIENYPR